MKLSNIDQEKAWSADTMLDLGWHDVTIEEVEEGTSTGGYPELRMRLANETGSIRDWQVVNQGSLGRVKQILEAAQIDIQSGDWDFDPATLRGRRVRILVGTEPSYKDPSKTVRVVKSYTPVTDSPVAVGDGLTSDKDLPF